MSNKCTACDHEPELEVTWSCTVVLPTPALSLNQVRTNIKGYGGNKYRTARNKYRRMIKSFNIPEAKTKRRVFFTRYWGKNQTSFDYGNLVGGLKPLLDSLVYNKVLIDDKPKYCSEYYRQYKSPDNNNYILITLEETYIEPEQKDNSEND